MQYREEKAWAGPSNAKDVESHAERWIASRTRSSHVNLCLSVQSASLSEFNPNTAQAQRAVVLRTDWSFTRYCPAHTYSTLRHHGDRHGVNTLSQARVTVTEWGAVNYTATESRPADHAASELHVATCECPPTSWTHASAYRPHPAA